MPTSQPDTDNHTAITIFGERLTTISEGQREIKVCLSTLEKSFDAFQRVYLQKHGDIEKSTALAHQRLDIIDRQMMAQTSLMAVQSTSIDALKDVVKPLVFASKITAWAAGIVGSAIVLMIFAILTHQVSLVFP